MTSDLPRTLKRTPGLFPKISGPEKFPDQNKKISGPEQKPDIIFTPCKFAKKINRSPIYKKQNTIPHLHAQYYLQHRPCPPTKFTVPAHKTAVAHYNFSSYYYLMYPPTRPPRPTGGSQAARIAATRGDSCASLRVGFHSELNPPRPFGRRFAALSPLSSARPRYNSRHRVPLVAPLRSPNRPSAGPIAALPGGC